MFRAWSGVAGTMRLVFFEKGSPVADSVNNGGGDDLKRLGELMREWEGLGVSGGAFNPNQAKRDQVLDELQELVGLGGKMVMEKDIILRAKKRLAGG